MIEFPTLYNRIADGMALFFETATYVSAKSFKVSGDWTGIIAKGMKVALTNDSKENFSYILSASYNAGANETTFTTFVWNFYNAGVQTLDTALANAAITNVYISGTNQCGNHPGAIILSNFRSLCFDGRTAIIHGWGSVEGTATAAQPFDTVANILWGPDVTFANADLVFPGGIGNLGRQNGAQPTIITDADGGTGQIYNFDLLNMTTTDFSVRVKLGGGATTVPTDWFSYVFSVRGVIA